MADRARVDACFDDTTTRTLEAHRLQFDCACGYKFDSTLSDNEVYPLWHAHVAAELRTALVAARIPEPCPTCHGHKTVSEGDGDYEGASSHEIDCPPSPYGCGGVGTIPGEELLVAMTHGVGASDSRVRNSPSAGHSETRELAESDAGGPTMNPEPLHTRVEEVEVYDYGDCVAIQTPCPNCDGGLLLALARFCSKCAGAGFFVQWHVKAGM